MTLTVHVAPPSHPMAAAACDAVARGGGRIVGASEAEALVWLDRDPPQPETFLHGGVRWVQLPSAGVERWVALGLLDTGRQYSSAGPAYAPSVAEHALALVLAMARSLHVHARATTWTSGSITVLADSTVAIVGCGRIGRALLALLQPFGCRIVAVTRSGRPVEGATETLPASRTREALRTADFVVLAAPAASDAAHLIGDKELNAMQPHAALVNVGRGALVDSDALLVALAEGRIRAAALDVTDPEPLPDGHALWREPRALITPHIGNTVAQAGPLLLALIEANVRRVGAGQPPDGLVDAELGY